MKTKILIGAIFLALATAMSYGFINRTSTEVTEPEIEAKINWVTIEEAEALSQKEPRKVLVDVYTDWCGWCKKMDKDTYDRASVVKYINKNYYAVKFDAEQKEEITLGDRAYKFRPDAGRRGVHELAVAMLNGKMSYPSTVFFDEKLQLIYNLPGYQKEDQMLAILNFFHDEEYKTNPNLQGYIENFKKSN